MNKTIFLAMMSFFILLMALSAQGDPGFEPTYANGQYANGQYANEQYSNEQYSNAPYLSEGQYFIDERVDQYYEYNGEYDGLAAARTGPLSKSTIYQTAAPSGAPAPVAPSSPESLRLEIPPESSIVDYREVPKSMDIEDSLISATDFASTDYAATGIGEDALSAAGSSFSQQRRGTSVAEYTYPSSSKAVVPAGVKAKNKLYVSYVPQTTGGCKIFGWQPMWLQIPYSGPVWFYEWYPNGELRVKYLGYSSAGWNKKWFNGDVPGWHILQYYCNGWSNYVYIYVYGQTPGTWTNQGPSIPASSSGTSAVTLRSSWLFGYDVYLDGKYIGTEGFGRDLSDGIYRFNVPGDMWHTIVITKDSKSYWETGTFLSGAAYRFTI